MLIISYVLLLLLLYYLTSNTNGYTPSGIESRILVPEKRALEPMNEHKLKGNFDFDELDWSNEEDNRKSFKRQKIQPAAERGLDRAKSVSTSAVQNSDRDGAIHDNLLEDALLSAAKVSAF